MKSPTTDTARALGFLASAGELGGLIAAFDWSATPLGPLAGWPQSLRTSVSLILNTQHPMWIGWGPDATFLYNDAYIEVLGAAKHPWALGRPAAEVWSEIWDVCGPLADKVFEPFFSTRAAGEGSGLGLTVVRQVLRRCGGRIELGRSELGGAVFTVELPLVLESAAASASSTPRALSQGTMLSA